MNSPLFASAAASGATGFLVLLALVLAFVLIGRTRGRSVFVAVMLSFYGATALYTLFPLHSALPAVPAMTAFAADTLLFLAFAAAILYILRRSLQDYNLFGAVSLIIISIVMAGFIAAVAYHVLGIERVFTLGKPLSELFSAQLFYWWFIAPFAALLLLA